MASKKYNVIAAIESPALDPEDETSTLHAGDTATAFDLKEMGLSDDDISSLVERGAIEEA